MQVNHFADSALNVEGASGLNSESANGAHARAVQSRGQEQWKLAYSASGPCAHDLTLRFRDDRPSCRAAGNSRLSDTLGVETRGCPTRATRGTGGAHCRMAESNNFQFRR